MQTEQIRLLRGLQSLGGPGETWALRGVRGAKVGGDQGPWDGWENQFTHTHYGHRGLLHVLMGTVHTYMGKRVHKHEILIYREG